LNAPWFEGPPPLVAQPQLQKGAQLARSCPSTLQFLSVLKITMLVGVVSAEVAFAQYNNGVVLGTHQSTSE
jgi:hypothetical protein